MKLIKPPRLEKGDTIGLVSPSEPVFFPERYHGGIEVLEGLGFKIKPGANALKETGYMAGSDQERAEDINRMFKDPEVQAVVTTTGGSCANRILPYLDYSTIKDNPKIFLGISDITPILLAIHAKTGLVTFHGPYLLYGICEMSQYNREYFLKAFTEAEPIGKIKEVAPRKILKAGRATGKLLGGNMSAMRTLIGTKYEPDWTGAIFFWEEYKTEPHNIDRMLMHYRLNGTLGKVLGLVSGNLDACVESKYKKANPQIEDIILEHCRDYGFPIMFNLDFGHNCENVTIPIGCKATVDTSTREFSIDESGVS